MSDTSKLTPVESGIVSRFLEPKGYGFIDVDGGGKLFFYIVELLHVGLERIAPGTRVKFCRGFDRDKRPKVARFLEINGAPAGRGTYIMVDRKFVLLTATPPIVRGVVERFIQLKAYGFALSGDRKIMFHVGQQGYGTEESFIPYRREDARPIPVEGDGILLWVVDGQPGTGGKAARWILERDIAVPAAASPAPESACSVEQEQPKPEVLEAPIEVRPPPPKPAPVIKVPVVVATKKSEFLPERTTSHPPEDEWIEVHVGRLRPERVSYGESEGYGQIQVPWSVFMQAKIKGLQKDEVLQVKCRPGAEQLVAFQVRRR